MAFVRVTLRGMKESDDEGAHWNAAGAGVDRLKATAPETPQAFFSDH